MMCIWLKLMAVYVRRLHIKQLLKCTYIPNNNYEFFQLKFLTSNYVEINSNLYSSLAYMSEVCTQVQVLPASMFKPNPFVDCSCTYMFFSCKLQLDHYVYTLVYAWRSNVKMHICMSIKQKKFVYILWSEVPKLVHTLQASKFVSFNIVSYKV